MAQPTWIHHPTIGYYYNWHPQWRRWVWNTTDNRAPFELHPVKASLIYFQLDCNIPYDPIAQLILSWGATKETAPETIQQYYETTGGWEVWVQSELHVAFENNPSRIPTDSTWREPHIYANTPDDKADFLLHFHPRSSHEQKRPMSVFIELKCELFGAQDTIHEWAGRVRRDIAKIDNAVVKKDHHNVTGPYHGYAIALTKTRVADNHMRGLGMTLEPHLPGQTPGFNLWWYHRVIS
ncbi:hypothetical protein MFRU_057g00100 [Monilinia fructicola]|nr:hypothetical protein MFRU_057g00100 [Monilinia fructicola]